MKPTGEFKQEQFFSFSLGHTLDYLIYLPPDYQPQGVCYPVLYLLHGRGDNHLAWLQVKGSLDWLIASGAIPALLAVMPDAPASERSSYYVDSDYQGRRAAGEKVETAFTGDLLVQIERAYPAWTGREARWIGGYSMGGYGALRCGRGHPELYSAIIALSPAVYQPQPPFDSSARQSGAFGQKGQRFVETIYRQKNYPETLKACATSGLDMCLFIAVGDQEYAQSQVEDYKHDLDFEAHRLYSRARRVANIRAALRVVDGGHDWDVWEPMLAECLEYILAGWSPQKEESTMPGHA